MFGNQPYVELIVRALPFLVENAQDVASCGVHRFEKVLAVAGRRMTEEMRRVIHTFGGDHPLSAIANTPNLSERRVKETLAAAA